MLCYTYIPLQTVLLAFGVKLAACRSLLSVLALHANVVEMLVENILREIVGV